MKDQEIIQLSDVAHLLLRPSLYIGAVDKSAKEEFVLESGKFVKKEITYVPALIKIINEAIDNSVDEATKTNFEFANRIKIDITKTSVKIEDNGRGIPVKKSPGTEHYMPVLAFCNARAGSNFKDDSNRESIGMNGIGIKAANVFSKIFKAETCDGQNKLSLVCKDNLSSDEFSIRKSSKRGTVVEFEPDFSRFETNGLDEDHVAVIKQRVLFLAMSYPDIKFYFNGERLSFNNEKSFLSLFSDSFELLTGKNWFIGVFPNEQDDFSFFTYVNGLYIKNGGNHINVVSNEIVNRVREKLSKKYKSLKPGDVRNKLSLVVFFKGFKNMKFDSQTKETLTNSTSEIKEYLNLQTEDWDNFGKKVLKNTELIEPIVEVFRIKEEFKKRQELKKLDGVKPKRIVSEKYKAAIGEKKYLVLSEGNSASGLISSVLGRQGIAYYALRGKPRNAQDETALKLAKNAEIQDILNIAGLSLTSENNDMDFEKIICCVDADADGGHILALLLAFFYRFAPELIKQKRITFLDTPLILSKKKGKIHSWFFDFESYQKRIEEPGVAYEYKKGLASWEPKDLQEVFKSIGDIEELLKTFHSDKHCKQSLENWLSNSKAEERKKSLRGLSCNITGA